MDKYNTLFDAACYAAELNQIYEARELSVKINALLQFKQIAVVEMALLAILTIIENTENQVTVTLN